MLLVLSAQGIQTHVIHKKEQVAVANWLASRVSYVNLISANFLKLYELLSARNKFIFHIKCPT